ncbi:hypothetical protein LI90_3570 [Carbonactinospora thermoautotrophica]|uniref:Uncharacterized protein n=1 Tax=Carbonactinospora thermoautotrophica TaxID=1469144 RepID=A0A132MXH9_9ACTN|nr:hypothetical protein LI90_3570 [Carbonactinospora thermoautotrophica]
MVSRETLEHTLAALRDQPAQPPVLIRLVPGGTPLPARTLAGIPRQHRGEGR